MTFPNIPSVTPTINIRRKDVINLLLASIAFEELGLAHLINAEAEKIQAAIGTLPGVSLTATSISQLLSINDNVNRMLKTIIKKEMLLQFKFEEIINISTSSTTSTTTASTTSTSTTTSTTSTTSTTTMVPCMCSGTISAGMAGTPEEFSNNMVNILVPPVGEHNIEGKVNIVCNCNTGTIDQMTSTFSFMANPNNANDNFGFKFVSTRITFTSCENGVLTVEGTGNLTHLGNATTPPTPAEGSYNYTLVIDSVNNLITIILSDSSGTVFLTESFEPSNGQGKQVSVVPCSLF